MLKDVGELVGVIAYGWGGVFAVMKPIGAFLGNSITLVYEMGKALGNIIVMSGALATGQLTLAKTTYDESKKSWDKIVELSEQNRTILTDGISNAITGYEQQAKASQTAQDKIRGHITGTAKIQKEVDKERATALKHANEQIEKEFNEAKRRADINYSAIQNIKGMEEEAYQMRIAQIDAEAAKRIKDGGDAVLLAKWVADEQQKAYIQMGKSADDWSKGVQASLLELTRQHTTWGNVAYEVTKAFTDNAKAQLQTNLFAVWKGNIDDIEFDWQSMMDAIGQKLTSKIADMVMEAAAHDILLMFKSEWVEGGSQVLGIVSQVLGFGDSILNMFSGDDYGIGDIIELFLPQDTTISNPLEIELNAVHTEQQANLTIVS